MLLHLHSLVAETHHHVQTAIAPLLLAAIPSIVGAAGKWLTGNKQQRTADQIAKGSTRPTYSTPQGIKDNASLAAFLAANGKMPGIGTYENRIASGQARTVGGAVDTQRDPSSIAEVLAASDKNYNDSMADMAIKGAQYKDQNIQRSMAAKNVQAQYDDKAWDWNQKQKYLSAMAASSALRNAGGMNKANAYNDVANVGTTLLYNMAGTGGGGNQRTPEAPMEMAQQRHVSQIPMPPSTDAPYNGAPYNTPTAYRGSVSMAAQPNQFYQPPVVPPNPANDPRLNSPYAGYNPIMPPYGAPAPNTPYATQMPTNDATIPSQFTDPRFRNMYGNLFNY